ncbi:MAG: FMN-binding negative transcriptional regulator [Rudaea sp.]
MTQSRFSPRNDDDVAQLIAQHPLAWVVSPGGSATPLPLRVEHSDNGRVLSLTGHFARANPQVAHLQADPRARLLFMGPHGYVSPSWFADRTQAPTWNYACANLDVRIEFLDNAQDLERIVRDLVDAMEAGRPQRWSVDDMHARYAQLSQRIIAFRAQVLDIQAKFKLGQDERDDVYPEIIRGLAQGGNSALIALMQTFNAQRNDKGEKS